MQVSCVRHLRDMIQCLLVVDRSLNSDKVLNGKSRDSLPVSNDIDSQPVLILWKTSKVKGHHIWRLGNTFVAVLTVEVRR